MVDPYNPVKDPDLFIAVGGLTKAALHFDLKGIAKTGFIPEKFVASCQGREVVPVHHHRDVLLWVVEAARVSNAAAESHAYEGGGMHLFPYLPCISGSINTPAEVCYGFGAEAELFGDEKVHVSFRHPVKICFPDVHERNLQGPSIWQSTSGGEF